MAEMAMQKPNASERRSRQARKRQSTEQTHVTEVTTGMAGVQMLPESSASEPGKNRRYTLQFIGHMQHTTSLPMHLNPEAGRRERGKALNKRMLQRSKQEWPGFRCCQNPVHLNLKKTEHTPCNSLDTCNIQHLYRKHTRFRCQ